MGLETLALVSAGLQVAQGVQGYMQNNAMAKAASRQAEANIQNQKNKLAIEQTQLKRDQQRFAGQQEVAAGASGATLSSFDALFEDTKQQSLVDLALLDYNSRLEQENIRYNGAVQKVEYKNQAKSSLLAGIGAAAQGYGQFKNSQPKPVQKGQI